jgi:octaprenyl-diphosphate synthase
MPGLEFNKKHAIRTSGATERRPSFELIRRELEQVEQRIETLLSVPDEQIQSCLRYPVKSSGKMIRPALVLLSGACVGRIGPEHIDLAAIVELIHRASLLHDDVIDAADIRRAEQTANSLWGNTTAVLLGDFLLSRAFSLSFSIHVDRAKDILSRTALDICCGELKQNIRKGQWDMSSQEYYQLIEAKTASLFSSSSRLGAMAADASPEQVEAMRQFGRSLGIAFQLSDDLLDIIGTLQATGKTPGTDLEQGKITLAVIHWIEQDPRRKQQRLSVLNQGCDLRTLIGEMNASGSLDYGLTQIREHVSQAKAYLETLPDNPAKQSLCKLADYIVGRAR